jgi:hypothetical protein
VSFRRIAAIDSVAGFVAHFEHGGALFHAPQIWYRGESTVKPRGSLVPSIARAPGLVESEWKIYQRFRQSAAPYVPHTTLGPWDWMLYMRHFGQHTRLLDWTESALAALYFSVENTVHDDKDGVVWCLDPYRLNKLAGREDLQCAGIDDELDPYTIESLHKTIAGTDFKPVAVIAPRSFPRLVAQQGVFTVTHREQVALDTVDQPHLLARVQVKSKAKPAIRVALKALGITRLTMYPELQSLGAST